MELDLDVPISGIMLIQIVNGSSKTQLENNIDELVVEVM